MTSDILTQVRRSALISTYGVGSLLPAGEDSVMVCGLDEWPEGGEQIIEPRLSASLGVMELRSPRAQGGRRGDVPAVRFPLWSVCPTCHHLGPFWQIADTGRRCRTCNETVSPSRFVSCCTAGHIEDFPYRAWVHRSAATPSDGHTMSLQARGHTSALADLIVSCVCGQERSMEGSFDMNALRGVKRCSGSRPWLINAPSEPCDNQLRTLQRGSSNVWFSITRSAISIPSTANRAAAFVESTFADANPDADPAQLAAMFKPPPGCTVDDIRRAIEKLLHPAVSEERPSERELRSEEYQALVNGLNDVNARDQFLCEELDLSAGGLPALVNQVSRVGRLREVRALTGFTRVVPVAPDTTAAPLSFAGLSWLPAVEVLGEGIFVRLDTALLDSWSRGSFAVERARLLLAAQDEMGDQATISPAISARSLLIHSLAHILIDELSLSAGYPAASIRERLYDEDGQSGILLFTATADSAGSLGGLAAQSDPARFENILANALRRAAWCTADPVCIESPPSGVNGLNLAACHACLLLPETSCEKFNQVLDRATLVGTPERPESGIMSEWMAQRLG